jgi:hypothetical protein
MALLLAVIL